MTLLVSDMEGVSTRTSSLDIALAAWAVGLSNKIEDVVIIASLATLQFSASP